MKSEGNNKVQAKSPAGSTSVTPTGVSPASAHTNTPSAHAEQTNPANISSAALGNAASANVKYTSSDIGVKTAVKIDPFAKHKERQQTERKERHKLYLIVGIVGTLIIVALIFWLIFALSNNSDKNGSPDSDDTTSSSETSPEDYENTPYPEGVSEEVGKVYEDANKVLSEDNNTEAAIKVFDEAIIKAQETPDTADATINQIKLTQVLFYSNLDNSEEVIRVNDEINVDHLNNEQKALLYDLVYLAYYDLGNYERATYYSDLAGEYTYLYLQEIGDTELEEEL